ncbi:MAG: hypothetical protein SVZ03_09965 [Spirochaetota bacterium]|nr:hypothetical protein [Spirochaetota bacterium]
MFSLISKTKIPALYSLLFAIFFALMFHPHWLTRKILSGDDASYISHAFTIGLDFDMNYSNEIAQKLIGNKNIAIGSIGSGILAAPLCSEKLCAKTQINVFGKLENSSGNGYMLDLPGEVINPNAWKYILIQRYLGFMIRKIVVHTNTEKYFIKGLSKIDKEHTINMPIALFIQTSILLLFWLLSGFYFGKLVIDLHIKKRDTSLH